MLKCFDLPKQQYRIWKSLVNKAISLADYLELHPLYKDQNYEDFLKALSSYKLISADKEDGKFYSGRERIRIPVSSLSQAVLVNLAQYEFWQNHYLEDPSFWKEDQEILASISHENMVMVEMDYFGKELDGLDFELYNI